MSESPPTNGKPKKPKRSLAKLRKARRIAETQLQLLQLKHARRVLADATEEPARILYRSKQPRRPGAAGVRNLAEDSVFQSDYLDFGGSDLFFQARSDGLLDIVPPSVPSDRKHGQNWPIYRTQPELDRIRQRSRLLVALNAYAAGLLRNLTNYTIGKGFAYRAVAKGVERGDRNIPEGVKALVGQVQQIVDQFLSKNRWNASIDHHAALVVASSREREIYRRILRDGEVFLRFWPEDDGSMTVRFIEPERVRNLGTDGKKTATAPEQGWSFGIQHQMDPEDVELPIQYCIYQQDPATAAINQDMRGNADFVEASEILHLKGPDTDSTLQRGLPLFYGDQAKALERAGKLQRNISIGAGLRAAIAEIWQFAGSTQAQVQAYQGGLDSTLTTDPITGEPVTGERRYPGQIRNIPKSMEYVARGADTTVSEAAAALNGDLRQGSAASASPNYWLGDMDSANYSNLETASAPPVKNGETEQEYYRAAFAVCVWRAIRWAVKCGKIGNDALKLVDIQVEAPAVLHRNELETAQQNQIAVQGGWKSPQTCAMEAGLDPEIEMANNEEFKERTGGGGLALTLPGEGMGKGAEQPAKVGKANAADNQVPGDEDDPAETTSQAASESIDRLPDQLLPVPDVRQLHDFDCGAASTKAVAMLFGLDEGRNEEAFIAELQTKPTDMKANGTRPQAIADWFARRGCKVTQGEGMTLGDLRRNWADGMATIVCVQDYGTPTEYRENQSGHYVVVKGLGLDRVAVMDPSADNAESGGRLPDHVPDSDMAPGEAWITEKTFLDVWHDMADGGKVLVRFGIAVGRGEADLASPFGESIHEDAAKGGQFKTGGGRETGKGEQPKASKGAKKSEPAGASGKSPGLAAEKQKFVGKTVGAAEHAAADKVSTGLAKSLGGKTEEETADAGQKDKKPYDVQVPKKGGGSHDIEVKSLLKGEKQSISVHEDALLRKVNHADAHPENTFHTVVRDQRHQFDGGKYKENFSGHELYYKRGSGRYTLSQMHKVKDEAELKALLDTPDHKLPEAARGKLPPPPPVDHLREIAAKASEARKTRDKARKERNKDKLRQQARDRAAKAKG